MTAKTFDPYEYIAVVAPGAIAALAVATQWPELRALLADQGLTVGGLGLFLVLSFVLGHITQAAGNLVEGLLWRILGGMPSNWVRFPDQRLIAPDQRGRLLERLSEEGVLKNDPQKLTDKAWNGITREIYSKLSRASRTERIDTFNRTYGLLRGLCGGFFFFIGIILLSGVLDMRLMSGAFIAAIAAGYRMYRFGCHYARELFIEFLHPPAPAKATAGTEAGQPQPAARAPN